MAETSVYLVDVTNGAEVLWKIPDPHARPLELATPESEVALRVRGGRAYWVDWTSEADAVAKVQSVAGDGGDVTTHLKLDEGIVSLEVDDQNAYAQIPGPNATFRIPLDGGPVSTYPNDDVLLGLGLDNGTLFFLDVGPDGSECQIRSTPVAGGDSTLVYEGKLSSEGRCEAMHFSAQDGHLFWIDTNPESPNSRTLKTIPTAGGTAVSLLTDVASWGGNFASDDQNVYLGAELADGRSGVLRMPIAGGEPKLLYAAGPTLVASDGARIYFFVSQGEESAAVLSVPK